MKRTRLLPIGSLTTMVVIALIGLLAHDGLAQATNTVTKTTPKVPLVTHTYKTVENCLIQADVYRLPGDDIRPVIFWIHGGALISGNRGAISANQLNLYLDAGYVVVSIDYRLAPETKLAGIIEDLRDAYQWVRAKGPELFRIDPNRLAVIGHSAGGYLTLMTGFCVQPRPRALVAFYGYGDIAAEWYSRPDAHYLKSKPIEREDAFKAVGGPVISETRGSGPRMQYYVYLRQHGLWPKEISGHNPDTEPRAFDRFCPARNVTSEYPPTLLLHGDQDTDVPFSQSEQMAAALKQQGVPHRLVRLEGFGHGFDKLPAPRPASEPAKPPSSPAEIKEQRIVEAFQTVLAFLKEHVGR